MAQPRFFFAPQVEDIALPKGSRWARVYLRRGFERLRPGDLIRIGYLIGIPLPTREELDRHLVYALVQAGYALSALRELFSRREVNAKPDDLESLYDQAVAQQGERLRPVALLEDNDLLLLVRVADYLRRAGEIAAVGSGVVRESETHDALALHLSLLVPLAAKACAKLLVAAPTRRGVLAALKRAHAKGEPWLIDFNEQQMRVRLSWAKRSGLWRRV
jgi:hypothetical protein